MVLGLRILCTVCHVFRELKRPGFSSASFTTPKARGRQWGKLSWRPCSGCLGRTPSVFTKERVKLFVCGAGFIGICRSGRGRPQPFG